jgi:hypothetical protein
MQLGVGKMEERKLSIRAATSRNVDAPVYVHGSCGDKKFSVASDPPADCDKGMSRSTRVVLEAKQQYQVERVALPSPIDKVESRARIFLDPRQRSADDPEVSIHALDVLSLSFRASLSLPLVRRLLLS